MHTFVTNPESPSTENWSMNYGTGKGTDIYAGKKACPSAKERHVRFSVQTQVENPHLWSPDSPYLYSLRVYVKDKNGHVTDGYSRRIGIRSIEFKGKDGFWLNGKPYPEPLIGANRHQDFAIIGNALSNSLHWRDAKKVA